MKLTVNDNEYEVDIEGDSVTIDGRRFSVAVDGEGRTRTVRVDQRPYRVELPEAGDPPLTVLVDGKDYQVVVKGLRRSLPATAPAPPAHHIVPGAPGAIIARMAGRILRIDVKTGDEVRAGDLLLILEAMKMENEIFAPASGRVAEVAVSVGQRVMEGATLLVIE